MCPDISLWPTHDSQNHAFLITPDDQGEKLELFVKFLTECNQRNLSSPRIWNDFLQEHQQASPKWRKGCRTWGSWKNLVLAQSGLILFQPLSRLLVWLRSPRYRVATCCSNRPGFHPHTINKHPGMDPAWCWLGRVLSLGPIALLNCVWYYQEPNLSHVEP